MTDRAGLHLVDGDAPAAEGKAPRSRKAWLQEGRELNGRQADHQWRFADWIARGRQAFGEISIRELADDLQISPGKISNYLKVSAASHLFRYRNTLAFSACLEVARLPEEDAVRILDLAAAGGWSVEQVREAAREAGIEGELRRAKAENARLREENARLKTDAKSARMAAGRLLHRAKLAGKSAVLAFRQTADDIEAFVRGPEAAALHGNARPRLVREIGGEVRKAAGEIAEIADGRIGPLLDELARNGGKGGE